VKFILFYFLFEELRFSRLSILERLLLGSLYKGAYAVEMEQKPWPDELESKMTVICC